MKITTKKLAREVAEITGLPYSTVLDVLKTTTASIVDHLKKGEKVYIKDIGTFMLKVRPARKVYVPPVSGYKETGPKKKLKIRISRSLQRAE